MDKLTNNQITSLHLLNLSHTVPLNPLNRIYKDTFDNFTREKCISLPINYIEETFCGKCGQVFIPGITMSIRIKYPKKKGSTNQRNRILRHSCLGCNHKSDHVLPMLSSHIAASPSPNVDITPKVKSDNTGGFKATWPKRETMKSKERLKKRKQNSLSNLLALKKKEKENESKQVNSLNLMEFMK